MSHSWDTLRGDLFGGITSAVVSLPMALAFGVVSGLGPLAGLYGAIAVGFFAALFGGTRSLISGPTGPMSVVMAVIVTSYVHNLTEAFTIVMMAGIIQILLGLLRIGRFIAYTPYSVISGFMSGIGVIIILLQMMPFLGAPGAEGGPMGALRALPEALSNINVNAFTIAVVTLAVSVLWPKQFRRVLPPFLAALIAGTLLGLWLTDTPLIGSVPTGLPEVWLPGLSVEVLTEAIQPALTLALLGAIDSLLTALIADSITRTRHRPNQELVGQGIGNAISGFFGGLPGAGNTLGTVVNARAGGLTRLSGMTCAAILLALVMGLGRFVEGIPLAVLAGILTKVGWDIIDRRFLVRIRHIKREQLVVMVTTLGLTVFLDLVTAVVVGLVVAGMVSALKLESLELDNVVSVPLLDDTFLADATGSDEVDPFSARVGLVAFRGIYTVASSNKMVGTLSVDIQEHEVVILDFSETDYMDDSAALVVGQLIDVAIAEDTECVVMGVEGPVADSLQSLDVLRRVPPDHFVADMDEARAVSSQLLGF
ncbi:MAG: SulP family inorganic anion transporter [bacterium]|nr:SulP family inorganic anion transporter [Acidimicrobiia bacterium]MCY4650815.1 SulP family inorganic anion transporter [bacterium]